jgi:hypothetical protein
LAIGLYSALINSPLVEMRRLQPMLAKPLAIIGEYPNKAGITLQLIHALIPPIRDLNLARSLPTKPIQRVHHTPMHDPMWREELLDSQELDIGTYNIPIFFGVVLQGLKILAVDPDDGVGGFVDGLPGLQELLEGVQVARDHVDHVVVYCVVHEVLLVRLEAEVQQFLQLAPLDLLSKASLTITFRLVDT